jgi:MFS family permease
MTALPASDLSPWRPLQRGAFRAVWIALVVSNLGTWMQSVGAAWLMTSLTPSPLLVALMQTATTLPIFVLGLPAGTLADLFDRRRLLIATVAWSLLVAVVLGALTQAGLISAWSLLTLTFLLGLGGALNAPAWQAIVPELVERDELPAAVSLQAMGFNVARAVGPAIGGLVVAASGPAAVFFLNAASFVATLVVLARWRRAPAQNNGAPEAMLGATAAGMRYVRHAPALRAVLVRVAAFMFGASALWALLPALARRELGLDATGYGILLGSLGAGAVGAALFLPRLKRRMSVDQLTAAATLVFAAATLALAFVRALPPLLVFTLAGGMAWLTIMSTLTVAAQTAAPAWVRARALSIYLLVFAGIMAAGSFAWGALAEQFGNSTALVGAALALLLGLAATYRWPLGRHQQLDLNPARHWADPTLAITPDPADGPVLITVEYRVPAHNTRAFLEAMEAMQTFRRREGSLSWGLFRDLADPDRYVETFIVATWAEHMRQHARVTVEDQAIEERAFAFQREGVRPVAAHLIAARVYDEQQTPEPLYTQLS